VATGARTEADQSASLLTWYRCGRFGKNIPTSENYRHLIGETQAMAGRSHHVGARMLASQPIRSKRLNAIWLVRFGSYVDGLTGLATGNPSTRRFGSWQRGYEQRG